MLPTAPATVTRSSGLSGAASVSITSSDGSALAGSDSTDSDQVLAFATWEVVEIVEIPIPFDPAPEASDERTDLDLSAPTGGAALGGTDFSDLQIFADSFELGSTALWSATVSPL